MPSIEIADKQTLDQVKNNLDQVSNSLTQTKSTVENTNTNVGSNADASSAAGSVHAKLKDLKTDVSGVNTKIGANTDAADTTTIFARLNQIYTHLTTYLSSTIASRIDAAISSRQASWGAVAGTKTNIDNTAVNVGSNADASSATGSVHAKLKDIKANIPPGAVKSVQSGFISSANVSSGTGEDLKYVDIPINNVNVGKCEIKFEGSGYIDTITTAHFQGGIVCAMIYGGYAYGWIMPSTKLINGTTLRLSSLGFDMLNVRGRWKVTEYY